MATRNIKFSFNFGLKPMVLCTIVFIVLKLAHIISWAWLWVLCPLWIGFAGWVLTMAVYFAFAFIVFIIAAIVDR
jgi:hypothetical protein